MRTNPLDTSPRLPVRATLTEGYRRSLFGPPQPDGPAASMGDYCSAVLTNIPPRGRDVGGWGGRIRTCGHGTKTRCLTPWLRPMEQDGRQDTPNARAPQPGSVRDQALARAMKEIVPGRGHSRGRSGRPPLLSRAKFCKPLAGQSRSPRPAIRRATSTRHSGWALRIAPAAPVAPASSA